jgi:Periplasmic component of the Tol biopolymer transport system
MSVRNLAVALALLTFVVGRADAQTIYEYKQEDARVLFFDKGLSQYIPHIIRMYENGKALHEQVWWPDSLGTGAVLPSGKPAIQPPMMMLSDWADDGNGGASAIPKNLISVEMAPLNFSYFISPSTERYNHLFRHEYTHTVMSDKASASDRFWRSALAGKFSVEPLHPFSAVWSYLGAPRWYAPRWYHEGIACFMETWTGGGVGRALGGYDEMYFRSVVDSGEKLYSVVGLEMEGTTSDFQVGTNSYLYGTRFVNYLEYKYGFDKLREFYNRTDDSKAIFSKQFKSVYGRPIRKVWDDWREFEVEHQKEQFAAIEEYPVTKTTALTDESLGSMSPLVLDEENNCAYTAVNYPGAFAHIERIDLSTLKRTKLKNIDGSQLYQTSYLTMDTKRQRLFWTTQNSKYRGLRAYDLKSKKMLKELNYQRVSNIVYDNVGDRLYGIFSNKGVMYICSYDAELSDRKVIYAFPFGVSIFDLAVSHDGRKLTVTTSGANGEQSLLMFDIEGLDNADFSYRTLCKLEDSNLGQFRFSQDDRSLIGSSYYTGVSNLWEIDVESGDMSLADQCPHRSFLAGAAQGRIPAGARIRPQRHAPSIAREAGAPRCERRDSPGPAGLRVPS